MVFCMHFDDYGDIDPDELDPELITRQYDFSADPRGQDLPSDAQLDALRNMLKSVSDYEKKQSAPVSSPSLQQRSKRIENTERINFRVDAELKRLFEQLCVNNRSTVSAELKRLMIKCVKTRSLS